MTGRRAPLLPVLGALAAVAAAFGGCAEVARPAAAPAPADLVAGAPDTARAAIAAAAAAFADRGAGLLNRPAAAALAAAQLEYATEALAAEARWASVPEGIRREMVLARAELRDAIGLDESASGGAAVAALLRAARALRAGDRRRAAAALAPPLFRPGGEGSIARLADTGPLPQVANATALAEAATARLQAEGRLLSSTQIRERSPGVTGMGLADDPEGY